MAKCPEACPGYRQVVGSANKHIARVAKFLTKYGELALFPVKLQAGAPSCICAPVCERPAPPHR